MHFEFDLFKFISTALSVYILFLYFSIFFDRNRKKCIGTAASICFVLWQLIVTNNVGMAMYIKLCVNMFFVYAVCYGCYKGKCVFKLIVSVLICVIWTLMEFLVGYIFILLKLDYFYMQVTGGIISKILTLFLIAGLRLFFDKLNIRKLPVKYGVMLLLIPVGSIYLIYNLFNLSVMNGTENTIWFCAVGLIIILLINLLVFRFCSIIAAEFELRRINALFMRQLELHNQYMQEKEEQIQLLRTERHDAKQRYCLMRAMIKNGEYKELLSCASNHSGGIPGAIIGL